MAVKVNDMKPQATPVDGMPSVSQDSQECEEVDSARQEQQPLPSSPLDDMDLWMAFAKAMAIAAHQEQLTAASSPRLLQSLAGKASTSAVRTADAVSTDID